MILNVKESENIIPTYHELLENKFQATNRETKDGSHVKGRTGIKTTLGTYFIIIINLISGGY